MTWPARTWVTAELVTATLMNAYLRDPMTQVRDRSILVGFGAPGGDVIITGVQGYFEIPWTGTVTGWTLIAVQVGGSIVIDVWKVPYASAPPTVANTIAGSEKPTLSAAQKAQDLSLTTWTTSFSAGDIFGFNIDSITGVKQASLSIRTSLV